MFYEQLQNLCEENNTTPTAFVRDILKLSTSKVTAWRNGSIPKIEILKKIADYFNVTVGYLFDGKEAYFNELSENKQRLLKMFDLLTDIEKGEILGELKTLTRGRSGVKQKGA